MKTDILSMTREEIAGAFARIELPRYRADQVFTWLHRRRARSFEEMTDLPSGLRVRLAEAYTIPAVEVAGSRRSRLDPTRKYLLALPDGNRVEAVWMEYRHGASVCISTQVGCRMGCVFCASTLGGLVRGLEPSEMLGEMDALERDTGRAAGSVVLMGIGEPLDNFENVLRFLNLLASPEGRGMSLRHVSLSTCGLVPEIDRLAGYRLPLTLSVSLHAPDDETRGALMPVGRRYPVRELMDACRRYFDATGRRVSFEYALIDQKNDTPEHAQKLIRLIKDARMPCHVNLIPVNEVRGRQCKRGGRERIGAFRAALERGGVNVTVRRELGADIQAACGQLRREDSAKGGQSGA